MTEHHNATPHMPSSTEELFSLLDVFAIALRFRRMIWATTFTVTLFVYGVLWLIPNTYVAVVRLAPVSMEQGLVVTSLAKSRSVRERLVDRFSLQQHYGEGAVSALEKATKVYLDRDGVINIEVRDTDPQWTAALANAYVEEINNFENKYRIEDMAERFRFLKLQLSVLSENLNKVPAVEGFLRQQNQDGDSPVSILLKKTLGSVPQFENFSILDSAVPPQKPCSPKRGQIALGAALVTFLLATMGAFIYEVRLRHKQFSNWTQRIRLRASLKPHKEN